MKKILSALALLLVMAGCSNTQTNEPSKEEDNKPAAITTLDCATFADELGKTESSAVRVFVADYEDMTKTAVEDRLTDNDSLKNEIKEMLAALTLDKNADQSKLYGTPAFFVDLNGVLDSNYARLIVVEDSLMIQTNEGFATYALNDDAKSAVKAISDKLIEAFPAEAEEQD